MCSKFVHLMLNKGIVVDLRNLDTNTVAAPIPYWCLRKVNETNNNLMAFFITINNKSLSLQLPLSPILRKNQLRSTTDHY